MEENPCPNGAVSRNSNNNNNNNNNGGGGNRAASGVKIVASKKNPYPVEDGGDQIECSGKYCKSCTAGFVADCVAVCCCPCALVNFLALAFVKVPYMVGRKCWGLAGKKKSSSTNNNNRNNNKKNLEEMKRKQLCIIRNETSSRSIGGDHRDCVVERNYGHNNNNNENLEKVMMRRRRVVEETGMSSSSSSLYSDIITPGSSGLEDDNFCSAGFEAEKVWFELYQVGHLGFGRVSFTGIGGLQSQGKGN